MSRGSRSGLPLSAGLLFLILACRVEGAETTFPALVEQWSSLSVNGRARDVKALRLAAGRLTLVLEKGSVVPVAAGGATVGLFFRGQGSLDLLSDDPVEAPAVAYNVKKNTSLALAPDGRTLHLRDSFEDLLWLDGGGSVAIPDAPEGAPLDDAFSRHVKRFAKVLTSPAAHQFPARVLDGPDRLSVRAEIVAKGGDLVYVLDGLDAKSETLSSVSRTRLYDKAQDERIRLDVLSDQPVGRKRKDTLPPRFVVTDVDLAVTASDGKDVTITATETIRGLSEPVRVLVMDLWDTRFAYTNVGGVDPRRLRLKGVFDEAGAPLPFDHRREEVAVALPAPLAPGRSTKVRFEIEGDILYRPGGDNYWELGVGPWFPQPDLSGQYYTVHALVKVKKPFVPFAPGRTLRRIEEGDFNVLETRIDRPVQFMVVLAGKYGFDEKTENGVTVRVASYARRNDMAIQKLLKLTHKVIGYYESFLGKFPFDEFNIVEIHSLGFGQAPPGFMFITSEAFSPIDGTLNQIFSKGANERFSHEIAHQYWGHVVKMPGPEEQWLTESFAEICAGLFVRDLRGKSDFQGLVDGWKWRAKEATNAAPIPLANRLRDDGDPGNAGRDRTYLLYFKGPWILDSIRREIGEDAFLKFLGSVQKTFLWRFGNTRQVVDVLEAVTKKDWKPYFDANYWGTEMPK